MAGVTVRNLVKTYPGQGRRATDDISLDVADGEFLVLVGPSGCGKTTLLRMVAGLETPDSGTVTIAGRDVTALPARDRGLSMVFQSYAIFPHLKVRENIGFGLRMRKVDKAQLKERVERAAGLLDLTDYLDRYPAQLSGGQRQRVAVARAIAVDADVLLMDEPLSNLDALLRMQFRAELKKIVARLGTTTLYVTHDQAEAMSLGDRVAVLRDGRISQVGSPLDVYDQPADDFVGGFLGAPPMNFFTATAEGGTLVVGDVRIPGAPDGWDGRKVLAGIRAENIKVSDTVIPGGADAEPVIIGSSGRFPAEVEVAEPTGASMLLTARWAGGELKIQAVAGFRAGAGDRILIHFPPSSLRFFDPETGLALQE